MFGNYLLRANLLSLIAFTMELRPEMPDLRLSSTAAKAELRPLEAESTF